MLVVSDLLLITGTIWLLQGLRVLPGSFMTGSPLWATIGAIAIAMGAFIQVRISRRKV